MIARRCLAAAVLVAIVGLAGCGGSEESDNAVEAKEGTQVTLGGLRYRVSRFRQLNPRNEPGRALYTGKPPGEGRGLYVLFLRACNDGDDSVRASRDVVVEDAFGQVFEPQPADVDESLRYAPEGTVAPGTCTPVLDTVARERFSGGALVFTIPFASARERPLIMEVRDGEERGRLQLDV